MLASCICSGVTMIYFSSVYLIGIHNMYTVYYASQHAYIQCDFVFQTDNGYTHSHLLIIRPTKKQTGIFYPQQRAEW